MGRPRQYASATERQAAYRQRMKATTAWVNRVPYERMTAAVERLHAAISRALHQGHPLAHVLYRASEVDTVEATVAYIVQQLYQEQEARK